MWIAYTWHQLTSQITAEAGEPAAKNKICMSDVKKNSELMVSCSKHAMIYLQWQNQNQKKRGVHVDASARRRSNGNKSISITRFLAW
jgi:hypothetical protein